MTNMIAKLICFFKGHRRGKRLYQGIVVDGHYLATFACPRCKAEHARKIKAPVEVPNDIQ